MIIRDDRTPKQKESHTWLIIGTDPFMSGWGEATKGVSVAAWACKPEQSHIVKKWVESRSDMKRIREVSEYGRPYRPQGAGHCHIYVVDKKHPALKGNQ